MLNSFAQNSNYETLEDDSFQKLSHTNENDVTLHIYGYKYSKFRCFIFHLVSIILLGVPYIVYKWYPQLQIFKYKKSSFKQSDVILLKDNYSHAFILKLLTELINIDGYNKVKYFLYQNVKFIIKNNDVQFSPLKFPYESASLNSFCENSYGITHEQHFEAIKLYGPNIISVRVKSYCQLFVDEVFNPFYIFQIFSIAIWSCDEYYIYAGCILFLSLTSIITSLYETKKQSLDLHNMVESSNCKKAQVFRPKTQTNSHCDELDKFLVENIDAATLVPNDLIILPPDNYVMPCDAVLLTGHCFVNESMLTGESVPVIKTPPNHSDELYDVDLHKRHTLFAGTQVIQTRFYGGKKVIARVVRTGFNTSKGELIKSILYPKPTGFLFYRDSMRFVLILSVIATFGMVYCIYLYIDRKAEVKEIFIRALDLITVVVPPALPAAMTVGTIFSQNRLKKRNIFCISPPRINICGKLKLICFDKTGTLTQDGLEFYGVLPSINNKFKDLNQEPHLLHHSEEILHVMASCHSLTRIDNLLTGDPLDLEMFQATKWDLEEQGEENTRYDMLAPTVVKSKVNNAVLENISIEELIEMNMHTEIGIIRQFPFSSSQQCMSVICRILGARNMTIFTKGAPEKVQAMCDPSTIPHNFSTVLSNYATSGYRIIAVASKQLPRRFAWTEALKIKRDAVECNLNFLGFIIMQNALKPETIPVINELHFAKIKTVMVTGDNIMTAISVSRDCGMVLPNENIILIRECLEHDYDEIPQLSIEPLNSHSHQSDSCVLNIQNSRTHIALDGKTWTILRNHYPELIPQILLHGTIFARFRPEQKTQLVMSLQELDYVVGMCGDGANDCGALKAAHIGISLSQAEASVAAPFTSATQNISCVKLLVSEGRCSLVTSFAVFKYMAMYSLIQFITILILYKRYTTLGDYQFLYIDLVITTSLAVTMGYQGPADVLVPKRPMGSLTSLVNVIPLLLQIILCAVVQYGALYYLTLQSWFVPLSKDSYKDEEVIVCWENTVVFGVSCYQYVILACVYSKGYPFRKSIFSNVLLLLSSFLLIIFTTMLIIYPIEPLAGFFEMVAPSSDANKFLFRLKLLIFPGVHFIAVVFIEVFLSQQKCMKAISHFIIRKKGPKNKYKKLEQSLDINNWLQLCSEHSPHGVYC